MQLPLAVLEISTGTEWKNVHQNIRSQMILKGFHDLVWFALDECLKAWSPYWNSFEVLYLFNRAKSLIWMGFFVKFLEVLLLVPASIGHKYVHITVNQTSLSSKRHMAELRWIKALTLSETFFFIFVKLGYGQMNMIWIKMVWGI